MIALVTCISARDLDADLPPLVDALDALEVPSRIVAWDDPPHDWSDVDLVVLRSTWNYHDRVDVFLDWVRSVDAVAPVWNRPETVVANTDKRYLERFAAAGIPTTPTRFVAAADLAGEVPTLDDRDLVGDVIVKPAVGAGSNGVGRFVDDPGAARRHISALHDVGDTAMIQPYLAEVDQRGETGLVYFGGRFSHAFRKAAIFAGEPDFSLGLYAAETVTATIATPAERAVADRVVARLEPTAYARIDLLPTSDGPVLLEVELTEPSLFLDTDPGAARRAAETFAALR